MSFRNVHVGKHEVHVLDRPIKWLQSETNRMYLRYACTAVASVAFFIALGNTLIKQKLWNASKLNRQVALAVDNATNYGEVKIDKDNVIFDWNEGMTLLSGYTYEEAIGKTLALLDSKSKSESSVLKDVMTTKVSDWLAEDFTRIRCKNGDVLKVRMNVRDVPASNDMPAYRKIMFDRLGIEQSTENFGNQGMAVPSASSSTAAASAVAPLAMK